MRVLIWHVENFVCTITERGRSPIVEEYEEPVTAVEEALLLLVSVEKADETDPAGVARKAADDIAAHARKLKVETLVVHPFAHLFGELSRPRTAVRVLDATAEGLRSHGLTAIRTPFGWFNQLEIKAKGHPLSRLARLYAPDQS
ncbi:MAG: threonyl-tRNA synthetase editing domain-containing protein [Anaerolineae bacterium]